MWVGKLYAQVHIQINYNANKLSLSGVVGALPSGDCRGNCGQINRYLSEMTNLHDGWTRPMVNQLVQYWDRWHLNDMRAACEHQRELGWLEDAKKEATLYNFRLKQEISRLQTTIKDNIIKTIKLNEIYIPKDNDAFILNLPYSIKTHTETLGDKISAYYEPKKPLYTGDDGFTETKTLGWLNEEDHPEGILSKACPVCGYKYGTKWLHEEVPQEVIDWLFALPDAKNKCVWNSLYSDER